MSEGHVASAKTFEEAYWELAGNAVGGSSAA